MTIDHGRIAHHQLDMHEGWNPPDQHVPVQLVELMRRDLKACGDVVKLHELDHSLHSLFKLHTNLWENSKKAIGFTDNVFFE